MRGRGAVFFLAVGGDGVGVGEAGLGWGGVRVGGGYVSAV